METVLERRPTELPPSDLSAALREWLPGRVGEAAGPGADFSACYARELSSLVWFVMSLGADAHRAADQMVKAS